MTAKARRTPPDPFLKKAAEAGREYGRDSMRERLRALPVNERVELIVDIFRIIAGEFAAMVLEYVEPPRPKRKTRSKP